MRNLALYKLSFWYLLGLILQLVYPCHVPFSVYLLLILFISCFLALSQVLFKSKLENWFSVFFIYLFFLFFGFFPRPETDELKSTVWDESYDRYLVFVKQIDQKESRKEALVKICWACKNDLWHQGNKNALLRIYCNKKVERGDYLLLKQDLEKICPEGTKHVFDYKSYLLNKGICFQGDVYNASSLKKLAFRNYSSRLAKIFSVKRILNGLAQKSGNKESSVLLRAVLFGDKSSLDKGLRQSFSRLGIAHLLAVSGLHVGMIYVLFAGLLKFFHVSLRWKTWILILIILIYSLITSYPSSVIRASLMLSIFLLARLKNSEYHLKQGIVCSAFLILLIRPTQIYDMGFLFSFSALLGIAFMYPIMKIVLHFDHVLLRWAGSLTAVSISAWLGTMPLVIYNFHSLPCNFILVNMVFIPLVTVFIYVGLFQSILFFIPAVYQGIDIILAWIYQWMLHLLNVLSRFDCFLIQDIYLSDKEALMIFLLTLFLFYALKRKSARKYFLLAFSVIIAMHGIDRNRQMTCVKNDHVLGSPVVISSGEAWVYHEANKGNSSYRNELEYLRSEYYLNRIIFIEKD